VCHNSVRLLNVTAVFECRHDSPGSGERKRCHGASIAVSVGSGSRMRGKRGGGMGIGIGTGIAAAATSGAGGTGSGWAAADGTSVVTWAAAPAVSGNATGTRLGFRLTQVRRLSSAYGKEVRFAGNENANRLGPAATTETGVTKGSFGVVSPLPLFDASRIACSPRFWGALNRTTKNAG